MSKEKKRIVNELYKYYLKVGICDVVNGEIIMLSGKELQNAAKELAQYSIAYPENQDHTLRRKMARVNPDFEYLISIDLPQSRRSKSS